jgi:hypothetical protein
MAGRQHAAAIAVFRVRFDEPARNDESTIVKKVLAGDEQLRLAKYRSIPAKSQLALSVLPHELSTAPTSKKRSACPLAQLSPASAVHAA